MIGWRAANFPVQRTEALVADGRSLRDADPDLISQVTRTIAERFHPRRIILFGSYARGQGGPDSDLDLFVEMETDRRPPERALAISAAFGLRSWPMDILVYTPEEVERYKNVPGSLLALIEREGKVLYERP